MAGGAEARIELAAPSPDDLVCGIGALSRLYLTKAIDRLQARQGWLERCMQAMAMTIFGMGWCKKPARYDDQPFARLLGSHAPRDRRRTDVHRSKTADKNAGLIFQTPFIFINHKSIFPLHHRPELALREEHRFAQGEG